MDDWTRATISGVVKASSKADVLPKDNEFKFFSSYKEFDEKADTLRKGVSTLINDICQFVGAPTNTTFAQCKDFYSKWDVVQDTADYCLEKVDLAIENVNNDGQVKKKSLNVNKSRRQFGVCLIYMNHQQ